MVKLDDQEELLWKLTNRVSELSYILVDIFQVAADGNNDDLQVREEVIRIREEVIRIISGASQPTKVVQRGIELLAKGVEGTCTNN